MSKTSKPTKKQKQLHFLILKGTKQTYYKNTIEVDYTPKKNLSALPMYNLDHKYYTPSFLIPCIEVNHRTDYKSDHQRKVNNTEQKSGENILVPRPKITKNYCSICKTDYEDYLTHIQATDHRQKLQNSNFQKQISLFCFRVQSQNTKYLKLQETAQKIQISDTRSQSDTSAKKFNKKRDYKHIRQEIQVNDFD